AASAAFCNSFRATSRLPISIASAANPSSDTRLTAVITATEPRCFALLIPYMVAASLVVHDRGGRHDDRPSEHRQHGAQAQPCVLVRDGNRERSAERAAHAGRNTDRWCIARAERNQIVLAIGE